MAFWLFMLLCELLCPAAMILFGRGFMTHPPQKINGVYGYRTARSMKSPEAWRFAHVHCGRLWWRIGWVMLPVTLLAQMLLLGKNVDTVGIWSGVIVTVQVAVMLAAAVPTERALKKSFDERGIRKP